MLYRDTLIRGFSHGNGDYLAILFSPMAYLNVWVTLLQNNSQWILLGSAPLLKQYQVTWMYFIAFIDVK